MIFLNTQQQTLEYQNCSFILRYLLSSKSRDIHAEPNLVLTRSPSGRPPPRLRQSSAALPLPSWWQICLLLEVSQICDGGVVVDVCFLRRRCGSWFCWLPAAGVLSLSFV